MSGLIYISTGHYPPRDRVHYWERYNRNHLVDVRCLMFDEDHFQAEQVNCRYGAIGLAKMSGSPHAVERSRGLLKRTPKTSKMLSIITEGTGYLHHATGLVELQAGDAVAYEADSEFLLGFSTPVDQIVLDLPADTNFIRGLGIMKFSRSIELQRRLIDRVRSVARDLLGSRSRGPCEPSIQLERAIDQLLHLDTLDTAHIWFEACQFIEAHLSDYRLNIDAVADSVGYSPRHLARIFSDYGTSVAGYIRAERLKGAYRDLVRVELAEVPVTEIAGWWGFTSPTTFSRAFSRRFGRTPSQARADAAELAFGKTKSRMRGMLP